ncbi:hypothetical protein [Neobacillus cucumis]|nr:hypothetical protein [Neobacillus cucumis]
MEKHIRMVGILQIPIDNCGRWYRRGRNNGRKYRSMPRIVMNVMMVGM